MLYMILICKKHVFNVFQNNLRVQNIEHKLIPIKIRKLLKMLCKLFLFFKYS